MRLIVATLHFDWGHDLFGPVIVGITLALLTWIVHAGRRIRLGVHAAVTLLQNGIQTDIHNIREDVHATQQDTAELRRMVKEHDDALRAAGILPDRRQDRRQPALDWPERLDEVDIDAIPDER